MAGVESESYVWNLFSKWIFTAGDDLTNGGLLTEAEKELLREELKKTEEEINTLRQVLAR